jgi:hypothetical protein
MEEETANANAKNHNLVTKTCVISIRQNLETCCLKHSWPYIPAATAKEPSGKPRR